MPTATAFRYPLGSFPFAASDISGSMPSTYVDNLSLATVMGFFWNLATFDLTLSGTATGNPSDTVDISGTYTLDPAGFTGSAFDLQSNGSCAWLGADTGSPAAFAYAPAVREPGERIIPIGVYPYRLLSLALSHSSGNAGSIALWLGIDPSNAGKYRIYYSFQFEAYFGESPAFFFTSDSSYLGSIGATTITNGGTFDFGGLTFTYYSGYYGDSYPGGTMSASCPSFSY